mmetsp:Transcript_65751/g.189577  ORF Transcript_65751/g.189577 Transcript_65751/m.189577 type:complete len:247 (-) Transcript_65751:695-1435(-)
MREGVADLRQEQVPDRALELGLDGLRFVGDVHLGQIGVLVDRVRLEQAGEHPDKGRLARPILPEHDQDLALGECASPNLQLELLAHDLHHVRVHGLMGAVVVAIVNLFGHLEGQRHLAESQVLGGHKAVEEDVDAFAHAEGHRDDPIAASRAPQAANKVRQVIQNGQVVLDHNDVIVHPLQASDDVRGVQTLPDIQIGRGLVEHVHLRVLDAEDADGEPLQLAAGQVLDVALLQVGQLELLVVLVL